MDGVRVLAFARVREVLGFAEREFAIADVPTVAALRARLEGVAPDLRALRSSTRVACNGAFVDDERELHSGDEIALLPPVGGG